MKDNLCILNQTNLFEVCVSNVEMPGNLSDFTSPPGALRVVAGLTVSAT